MLVLVLVTVAPAVAQPAPEAWAKKEGKADAVVNEDVYGKTEKGKAEAKAGDVVAKAESEPPKKEEKKEEKKEVKVEVKKEEKKEEKKQLPKTGGTGSASLLALGAGALLVGGGLLVRRLVP